MTLITGAGLDPDKYFSGIKPEPRASSFDLKIGRIYDHDGNEIYETFVLKPRHMVQVISLESFDLPDNVTGHVTYKTALTRIGIWALTVGIVDPGWKGPISTTLLNFSNSPHPIAPGDTFLRVSLFNHDPVSADQIPKPISARDYRVEIQKIAASRFPPTFLDSDEIAQKAAEYVLSDIQKRAILWISVLALVFTIIQIISNNGSSVIKYIFS